ncbi:AI-2E family transporter [Anabaena subtropica]|uniref:AI-2E family transporter n=1 Tax=Anabaena subtropica FACHB-260 TaxID=2692884 RepID=A0ABR8CMA0_9NOST|nr:AI-2E family transporter [Anabaena subtropica]MBD2344372.1 AI-2E family transporter [Anabaena subtropica FACHB-260]
MNISLNQLLKWLILTLIFPLVCLNGWLIFQFFQYFKPLVTIFVLAILLAFILNYPVSSLQERGVKRSNAVSLVFVCTVLILVASGITLLPIAIEQFHEIAKVLPQWIDSSQAKIQNLNNWALGQNFKFNIATTLTRIIDKIPDELEYFSNQILKFIIETVDSISEALVTVVITFYLLVDGPRIWEGVFKKLPLSFAQKLNQSIQRNFQNYLIGQGTLALLMGTSQTLLFLVFQVQFGLLFGLGVGFLSLIPFGDVVSLIVITLIVATHDFWLAVKILAVAVVIDQIIDQAIAPRLLGSFTGLRPIWVLVSLLVGTYLGGVLGLLIAVPVAGLTKDIIDDFSSQSTSIDNALPTEAATEILKPESSSS